jgi:hypothetical protein
MKKKQTQLKCYEEVALPSQICGSEAQRIKVEEHK